MKDEFNSVEVTNDKQIHAKEFGKVQQHEFSSHADNKVPKGDLNDKNAESKVRVKEELNLSNYTKNITSTSGTEAATEGTVTVTSSATASTIASTTSSVAVVASTVAVTAVAVATGISVALHDYQYKFNTFIVTADSLTYELIIKDNKQESNDNNYEYDTYGNTHKNEALNPDAQEGEEPFVLRVFNDNYDYSMSAYLDYNYGVFSGLTLGQTYHISLSENRYGGELIFDETFTTVERSKFNSFAVTGAANFQNNSFYVTMDYIDDANQFTDLTLTFLEDEGTVSFPLEKKIGEQIVEQGDTSFRPLDTHKYVFSYKYQDEVVEFVSREVTFIDISGGNSEFKGITWDKQANYLTNEFDVKLDYQDDFNFFSDFALTLTQGELSETFSLAKSLETQTLKAETVDLTKTCSYSFTYKRRGIETVIDSGSVLFTDNSGGISEITGVTWDKTADYLNKTFDVKLDYQDDFNHFSNFSLILSDESIEEAYPLQKTTVIQTIALNENTAIDFDNTYNYSFVYMDQDEEKVIESGTVHFTDNSGAVSEVYSVSWDKKVNYLNKQMEVTLSYKDDLSRFSDFTFYIEEAENTENSGTFSLEKTTEAQTFTLSSQSFEFKYDTEYNYAFKYKNKGEEATIDSGTAVIADSSGAVSEVNGVIWDKEVNYLTSEMSFKLDFTDELDRFTDFAFYLEEVVDSSMAVGDGVPIAQSATYPLEKTTEVQTIVLTTDTLTFDYEKEYNYSFTYKDLGVGQTIETETIHFLDSSGSISEINDLSWDGTISYVDKTITVNLDYQDDLNRFSDFVFHIEDAEFPEEVFGSFPLEKTTEPQVLDLSENEDFYFSYGREYSYYFTYSERGVEKMFGEKISLVPEDNSGSVAEFNRLYFDRTANFITREFEVQLDYDDELDRLSDFTIELKDLITNEEKTFNLEKTTEVQTLSVNEMDDEERYLIDITENEVSFSFYYYKDGVQQTVINNDTFTFENSLHSEVNGIETNYDFTSGVYQDPSDPYTGLPYGMPLKLDFNDEEEKWRDFNVSIHNHETDEVIVDLNYINEVENLLDKRWHYMMLPMEFMPDDIADGSEYDLVITAELFRENSEGELSEEVYRRTCGFTRDRESEFFDLVAPSSIIFGGSNITVFPVYSGYGQQTKMILELRSTENTYRYEVIVLGTISDGVTIDLSESLDGNWVEEVFREEVESGQSFSLYLLYYTYPVNVSGMSVDAIEELAPSAEDYIEICIMPEYYLMFEV